VRGSPKEIAVTLRRRALQMEREVRATEAETAREALKIARLLSSGLYTLARLRRMGHPYAAARPQPPQNRAIINAQTGTFFRSWKIRGPRKTARGIVTKLVNDSSVGPLLVKGTSRMIPRPIVDAIRERIAAGRRRRLDQAIRRSLSGR
jgi:hypothetical protein